jgi:hypothetical protein
MSGSKDSLQIPQDLEFQRQEWRVQKIVWMFVVVLLAAAIVGLLGPGALSSASTGRAGFSVRYMRFARWQAPQTLLVSAGPDDSGTLQLSINRSFLDSMAVQQITPEPAGVKTAGDSFLYTFDLTQASRLTDVAFDLQPTSMGTIHGAIAVVAANGQSLSAHFTQLVYP